MKTETDQSKAKNLKVFLIVIGFAAALGIGTFLCMWNIARHSPTIIHENEPLTAVQPE